MDEGMLKEEEKTASSGNEELENEAAELRARISALTKENSSLKNSFASLLSKIN